jgi:hypothetical protein
LSASVPGRPWMTAEQVALAEAKSELDPGAGHGDRAGGGVCTCTRESRLGLTASPVRASSPLALPGGSRATYRTVAHNNLHFHMRAGFSSPPSSTATKAVTGRAMDDYKTPLIEKAVEMAARHYLSSRRECDLSAN